MFACFGAEPAERTEAARLAEQNAWLRRMLEQEREARAASEAARAAAEAALSSERMRFALLEREVLAAAQAAQEMGESIISLMAGAGSSWSPFGGVGTEQRPAGWQDSPGRRDQLRPRGETATPATSGPSKPYWLPSTPPRRPAAAGSADGAPSAHAPGPLHEQFELVSARLRTFASEWVQRLELIEAAGRAGHTRESEQPAVPSDQRQLPVQSQASTAQGACALPPGFSAPPAATQSSGSASDHVTPLRSPSEVHQQVDEEDLTRFDGSPASVQPDACAASASEPVASPTSTATPVDDAHALGGKAAPAPAAATPAQPSGPRPAVLPTGLGIHSPGTAPAASTTPAAGGPTPPREEAPPTPMAAAGLGPDDWWGEGEETSGPALFCGDGEEASDPGDFPLPAPGDGACSPVRRGRRRSTAGTGGVGEEEGPLAAARAALLAAQRRSGGSGCGGTAASAGIGQMPPPRPRPAGLAAQPSMQQLPGPPPAVSRSFSHAAAAFSDLIASVRDSVELRSGVVAGAAAAAGPSAPVSESPLIAGRQSLASLPRSTGPAGSWH